jgi:L-amino acid N-acyltransferase YncA
MILRFATVRDAEAVTAIYAPIVESTVISFETVAPSADEMRSRIGNQPSNKPWIVAEIDRTVAGYAYASAFRGRSAYRFGAEVGVYVAEGARRRGVGHALYRSLLHLMTSLGYRRAFAGISLPNDGSIALHRAVGFTEFGIAHAAGFKFGAWHDVGFYECALGTLDIPQHDPLAVDMLAPAQVEAAFERSLGR